MAIRDDFAPGEILVAADLNDTFGAKANLASPTFTGTPAAPTASAGTNTTQLATTAFVQGAGGLVLVASESFSAVSSVSINGCFSSTYKNYRIFIGDLNASSAGITEMRMRLRASGSDLSTSTYAYQFYRLYGAGIAAPYGAVSQTNFLLSFMSTGAQCYWVLDVHNPNGNQTTAITQTHYVYQSDIASTIWGVGGGYEGTAYQATGFSIFPAAGTISGLVKVYGYKD